MLRPCIVTDTVVQPGDLELQDCGGILNGSTHTFTWSDTTNNVDPLRRYDLAIDIGDGQGFVDQGPSVQYPTNSWTVTGLPTDGRTITKRLYYWDNNVVDLSNFVECTCTAASVAVEAKGLWPAKADDSRVLGGVAYGAYLRSGVRVSNSISAYDHAVLFRAWKTGTIDGFEIHNRTPSPADLNAQGGPERWRSFMISGTYRYGNGGTYEPVIHQCGENEAIGEPLGPKGSPYVLWPANQPGNAVEINPYRGMNFNVVAGEWYWLVLENLTPPPGKAPVSAAVAQSWGNNVGYTALNGNQVPEVTPGCPNKFGAIGGDSHTRHFYKDGGTVWSEWTRESTWIQFHYTDGEEVGDIYIVFAQNGDINGSQTEFAHEVQGSRRIRQRIRFPYPATTFDRFELYFGHNRAFPAPNGSPLRVDIKTLGGTLLATAFIPAKPNLWIYSDGNDGLPNAARDGKSTDRHRKAHVMAPLNQPVTLQQGQDYVYEYSAPAGANFRITRIMTTNIQKAHPTREYLDDAFHFSEWGPLKWSLALSPSQLNRLRSA